MNNYTVFLIGYALTPTKSVKAYRVYDASQDIFVGLDGYIADHPFLTLAEAKKVCKHLNGGR